MRTIGVFFGSRSTEHDISIITAQLIISALKSMGEKVIPVYLNREGKWLIDKNLDRLKVFTDLSKEIDKITAYQNYYLDLKKSNGKIIFKNQEILGETITIDLAFPAFHGTYGEDGKIQGLFEMFNVPYVGC
ncbi:MAG: hypothetical protein ACD_12C00859G0001, partial [uncultured bacterium]